MPRLPLLAIPISLGLFVLVALMLAFSPTQPGSASPASAPDPASHLSFDPAPVISAALAYIGSQQQADGGIDSFGFGSDPDSTSRALLALVAAGRPVSSMQSSSGSTLVDYLSAQAITYTHDASGTLFPGRAGILLTAVSAAGSDPHTFGDMDLVSELTASFHPATGAYSTTASQGWSTGAASDFSQAWAILSLSASGNASPMSATEYLHSAQAPDGSWGFGDPDTTALALTALLASGNYPPNDPMLQNAVDFFRQTQLPNGGWRPAWDDDPLNADSTGWIIQALYNAGYAPLEITWTTSDGDPLSALVSLAHPDGSIGGTYVNAYSTSEALFGLTGSSLANLGAPVRANRALSWMSKLQNPDGSWSTLFGHPAGATVDAVLAFAAGGYDPHSLVASGSLTSAVDYLSANALDYILDCLPNLPCPDAAGKLLLAIVAMGEDPYNFGEINPVYVLTLTYYNPTLGGFGVITNTWHQAYAILGLSTAGAVIPISATQTLLDLQQPDGGWRYDLGPWGTASSVDSTALALQALSSAGVAPDHPSILAGIDFLHATQDAQGGWDESNSTAYAIQGLLAVGQDLDDPSWRKAGHTPYAALAAYQKSDGPFAFDLDSPWGPPVDDFFATRQALPGLLGVYFPFTPATAVPFKPLASLPDPDRSVALPASASWGQSVLVTVPIGADSNQNAELAFDWRPLQSLEWITGTQVSRGSGFFTATLPLVQSFGYEFRLALADPELVQYGETLSASLTITSQSFPHALFLPLIYK